MMFFQGLSPHTRGKLSRCPHPLITGGPIPAYAGETHHPDAPASYFGAYPRIRGGNQSSTSLRARLVGLSPHTRGKPQNCAWRACRAGPIPAYAGETGAWGPPVHWPGAYPRIRGGNCGFLVALTSQAGLSPHTRGKRKHALTIAQAARPIPAYAGETICFALDELNHGAYPRIRGGNMRVCS